MTKEYDGDYYFPDFEKTPTGTLRQEERKAREMFRKAQALAEAFERKADEHLWELNYRKHVAVLKPMVEDQTRLHKIINDPSTKKTVKAKAIRAAEATYKSIWYLMKYGKDLEPEKP